MLEEEEEDGGRCSELGALTCLASRVGDDLALEVGVECFGWGLGEGEGVTLVDVALRAAR